MAQTVATTMLRQCHQLGNAQAQAVATAQATTMLRPPNGLGLVNGNDHGNDDAQDW